MNSMPVRDFVQIAENTARNHAAYVTPHNCDCGHCRWVRQGQELARVSTEQGRRAFRDLGRFASEQGQAAARNGQQQAFGPGGMLRRLK